MLNCEKNNNVKVKLIFQNITFDLIDVPIVCFNRKTTANDIIIEVRKHYRVCDSNNNEKIWLRINVGDVFVQQAFFSRDLPNLEFMSEMLSEMQKILISLMCDKIWKEYKKGE